jgi:hypothetical protein
MIAAKTGVPLLPVAVKGRLIPFSIIKVIFGNVFMLDADKSRKYQNNELVEMSKQIMSKSNILLEDN